MPQPLIYITRKQALYFAVFLVLYEFLTYIANDMIMPGMIKVIESFNGSETDIANSLMVYLLGGASLQLFLGPLSDRYGRRPIMLLGAVLFLICTILIACSQSMGQFMGARFFQGMGLCFIGVVGYATLQEIFAEMDAIRLISIMASVALVAPLIGPLLGAICIHYLSWRWIFVLVGVLALVALWGLYQFMPETVGQLQRNGEIIERTSLAPKMILSNYKALMIDSLFMKGSTALGLQLLPCIVWIALSPIILIKEADLSFIEYGLWQLPIFGASILGNLYLRHMTRSKTLEQLVVMGSCIMGGGLLLMFAMTLCLGNHYLWLMPGIMIYFFGIGLAGSPLYRQILFSTSVMKGTASALMSMFGMCIQAIGLELMNECYETHSHLVLSTYCLTVGLIYVLLLKRH